MVVRNDQPIAMPRPFGGDAPMITISPRADGKSGQHITVQITGAIQSVYQYLEFIQVLDLATEDDLIDVILDTPGGCVFTTQVLLERMNSSKATVTTVASGLVASAGTFLWFFSKHRKVDDWATFMFHSSSHGDYGKSLAIQETSTEMVRYMYKTVKAMVDAGILTSAEAGRIFRQKKDLFLPASIIRARMLGEMAATENLRLRDEVDSPDFEKDPAGKKDPDGETSEDGKTTEVGGTNKPEEGEPVQMTPEDIFKAEGIFLGEGDEGGDEAQPGEGEGESGDQPGEGETVEGKRKGKKAAKRRRPRGEGDEGGEGEGAGDDDQGGEGDEGGAGEGAEGRCGRKAKRAKKRPRSEGEEGGEGEGEGETVPADDPDQVADAPASAYLRW